MTTVSVEGSTLTHALPQLSPFVGYFRILGVTLARGGSKGVPKKNIRMVAGKPLLAWTIEEVAKTTLVQRYVVSTDDQEIADIATSFGVEVLWRAPELARDDTPAIDALLHALHACDGEDGPYDIVADIRCTNALKTHYDIDGAVHKLMMTGADCVCGITRLEDHHPMRIKTIVADRLVDVWPENPKGNREDLRPDVYIRNGSIYAVRATALRRGIHFTGGDVRGWIMPLERSVNIDTELDLLITDVMLKERNNAVLRGDWQQP